MDWGMYAWLKRGKRRIEALKIITNSKIPLTVKEVKIKLSVAMSQSSYTVKELLEKKLIECLNPKDKIGRLYKTTKKGIELSNAI